MRSLLHSWGLRFRVNDKVPGMPRRTVDIMFRGPRVAVFLDGCFWHCCPVHGTSPGANAEWWQSKLGRNVARDRETNEHLAAEGWTVLRFWEHESVTEVATKVRDVVREAQKARTVRAGRCRRGAGTTLPPPPPAD